MKSTTIFFLTILSISTSFSQTIRQPIQTSFSFLSLPIEDQARGMANIGVVAAPDYYGTAIWQNPALLYRGKRVIGGNIGALSLETANPFLLHGSAYMPIGKRATLAYGFRKAKYKQQFFTNFQNTIEGVKEVIRPYGMQKKLSYGYALTPNLSIGAGFGIINSLEIQSTHHPLIFECGDDMKDSVRAQLMTAVADIGLHYRKDFSLSCSEDLRLQGGVSVVNMGPKVRRAVTDASDFLPTTMRAGGLLGWRKANKSGYVTEVDLAYQVQKLLVPSAGNGSFYGAARGMISSFVDARDGLQGELEEISHQFGAEWRQRFDHGIRALRMGFFYENPALGNRRYLSLGGSVSYYGFRWDVSYIFLDKDEKLGGGFDWDV